MYCIHGPVSPPQRGESGARRRHTAIAVKGTLSQLAAPNFPLCAPRRGLSQTRPSQHAGSCRLVSRTGSGASFPQGKNDIIGGQAGGGQIVLGLKIYPGLRLACTSHFESDCERRADPSTSVDYARQSGPRDTEARSCCSYTQSQGLQNILSQDHARMNGESYHWSPHIPGRPRLRLRPIDTTLEHPATQRGRTSLHLCPSAIPFLSKLAASITKILSFKASHLASKMHTRHQSSASCRRRK
jgi:hypothetical protein